MLSKVILCKVKIKKSIGVYILGTNLLENETQSTIYSGIKH
jgi:hypothetical protein